MDHVPRAPVARTFISGLAALALVGCGGGGATSAQAPHAPGPVAPGGSGAYRWLVRTTGAPPSIAAENRHRGTSAWRLPGPATEFGGVRSGSVTGYVAAQALWPGQVERIYVAARGARRVRIRVFRIGWYRGRGGREVLVSRLLPVVSQPTCLHRAGTGLTECDWHPTLSFRIPPALPSGVYIAKLSASTGASDCLFVVLARRPQPLLVQLPTSTYEAYNAWGGDSLYPGGLDRVGVTGTTQGVEVSYDRPYDSITGAGQFFARDVTMVRFLERHGYPVSYTTSEAVDRDPTQLSGHKAVLDLGHSEYWSARQYGAFGHARYAGTSLLFFGSDTLAWRVRYAPASPAASQAGQPDQTIIAYKERAAALDPDRAELSGPFPGGGAPLTGSSYLGCITPRVPRPGPPTYRYYAWAPSPQLRPRWLFRHTGISPLTRIPAIVGYELDQRTLLSPAGTRLIGAGAAPCMGVTERGEPIPGPGNNRAETTLYTARSGALVFATGTLGWALGPALDPRVAAITRNLLAHVLARGCGPPARPWCGG